MRLVHDQVVVFRQHAVADLHVGQQQRVVDNEHMRRLRLMPRLVERARAAHLLAATLQRAALILGAQPRPDGRFLVAAQRDFTAVARFGVQQPDEHLGQQAQLGHRGRPPAAQRRQPARAQVVAAPLDQRRLEGDAQRLAQHGQVAAEQLILQIDRGRADHHALVVLRCPGDGRDQVGHALADAGGRFDHEVPTAVERLRHPAQHVHLLGPVLVAGEGRGHVAARLDHPRQPVYVQRTALSVRAQRPPGSLIRREQVISADRRSAGGRVGQGSAASLAQRRHEHRLGRPF